MLTTCPEAVSYTHLDVYKRQVLDCLVFAARRPPLGAWLAKRKSSSLRCGIFFCQALRKKAIQGPEAYKIGKTYPDGIIHS